MIDLGRASRFVAGAIGDPGDRTFYLEVHSDVGVTWFVVEKLQVAALAVQIIELMANGDDGTDDALQESAEISPNPMPVFRVTEIRIASAADGRYRVELHPVESSGAEPAVFLIEGRVLAALAAPALQVVQAGRPRCPRCGLAIDPEGHACPTGNGDLRDHRP